MPTGTTTDQASIVTPASYGTNTVVLVRRAWEGICNRQVRLIRLKAIKQPKKGLRIETHLTKNKAGDGTKRKPNRDFGEIGRISSERSQSLGRRNPGAKE